jgi:hypothetical protein
VKRNPNSSAVDHVLCSRKIRGPFVGSSIALWGKRVLLPVLVAGSGSMCMAAEAQPATATAPPVQAPAITPVSSVLLGMPAPCADLEWKAPPDGKNQTITFFVKYNTEDDREPPFAIDVEPRCAALSHKGKLTLVIDTSVVKKDWKTDNTVDLEFGLPKPKDPGPRVKGPFELDKKKQKKRGIYEDIVKKDTIPKKDFSSKVLTGWHDTYTVKIFTADGEFLGEADPGVKVIDDPESMIKK